MQSIPISFPQSIKAHNGKIKASLKGLDLNKKITVIGGGAIGSSAAWHLASLGYEVSLIDPGLKEEFNHAESPLSGTKASLGVLMGNIFKRQKGRGWKLRQESMRLWPNWINQLKTSNYPLCLEKPLIRLANSFDEASSMHELVNQRKNLGLEILDPVLFKDQYPEWPKNNYGGLISHQDGRIDTHLLQICLKTALEKLKVKIINQKVILLERKSSNCRWSLFIEDGTKLEQDIIILCTASGTDKLLKTLGHNIPMNNVIGQVLELEITKNTNNWKQWPAVLISNGINLIPKGSEGLLVGATLETDKKPSLEKLNQMKSLEGNAPNWLKKATIKNQWYGTRSKPINQPAPIIEILEPGLILSTGHYRNGILLAPATAQLITKLIINECI